MMGILGISISLRVNLQPPLQPIKLEWNRVYYCVWKVRVVLQTIDKLTVLGHKLMYRVKGVVLIFKDGFTITYTLHTVNILLTLDYDLPLTLGFKILSDVIPKCL